MRRAVSEAKRALPCRTRAQTDGELTHRQQQLEPDDCHCTSAWELLWLAMQKGLRSSSAREICEIHDRKQKSFCSTFGHGNI